MDMSNNNNVILLHEMNAIMCNNRTRIPRLGKITLDVREAHAFRLSGSPVEGSL